MDDGAEYLKPTDLMPLSDEETQAVVLMRSFCPEQSTPDATVGMCIAEGFSKCLPGVPPVLTKSGVVKGDRARLPNNGIESFVNEGVVRRIVFHNAQEYHTVIATVRKLQLDDLLHALSSNALEEDKLAFFLNWWTKYARTDVRGAQSYGLVIKDAVKFFPAHLAPGQDNKQQQAMPLKNILFYVEKGSALAKKGLPMPETVIARSLQVKIGSSVITDPSLREWFSPLPFEVWVSFVAQLPLISQGRPEDEALRLDVLSVLSQYYSSRPLSEKVTFGSFLASLLGDKKCLQFDDAACAVPADLYTYSAELGAFESVGSFHKVSHKLKAAGISEDFLLSIGVRKSVSIDFLFASLDKLRWSSDPKPLIEYLRSSALTKNDFRKLTETKYLPAENFGEDTFAPSELYLPNSELRLFPFVRMLQWPSEEELTERSASGAFLVKLGMKTLPPLSTIFDHLATVQDDDMRIKILDFVADRLGPHGHYQGAFARMSTSTKTKYRFMPCLIRTAFGDDKEFNSALHSPISCYSNVSCSVMGFPVVDPGLGDRGKLYGSLFQCPLEPQPDAVIQQLVHLVTAAQSLQAKAGSDKDKRKVVSDRIEDRATSWYNYLSHRSSDFSKSSLDTLRTKSIVPCKVEGIVKWFRADQVFFRKDAASHDSITGELFHLVDFNPFLATLGGK
jgi:hypothetical protein